MDTITEQIKRSMNKMRTLDIILIVVIAALGLRVLALSGNQASVNAQVPYVGAAVSASSSAPVVMTAVAPLPTLYSHAGVIAQISAGSVTLKMTDASSTVSQATFAIASDAGVLQLMGKNEAVTGTKVEGASALHIGQSVAVFVDGTDSQAQVRRIIIEPGQ